MSAAHGVAFDVLCRALGLPVPLGEYQFALVLGRHWRFDWAWPAQRVALEVEGGAFTQGRHTRGKGFIEDMDKYNAAQLAGWIVLRVTPTILPAATTVEMVRVALALKRVMT